MADSPLLVKSKSFALDIIRVCNEIKQSRRESVLTNQLIRSGTSVGANIREAFYAHGKADFIGMLQFAVNCKAKSIAWKLVIPVPRAISWRMSISLQRLSLPLALPLPPWPTVLPGRYTVIGNTEKQEETYD